jgi:aldoxime dehydratase
MTIESAIPEHLRRARTRHIRVPGDYAPPYPSYSARFQPAVSQVVMAYFGAQWRGDQPVDTVPEGIAASGHWDRATYVDERGYQTLLNVAYWDDIAAFDTWFANHGKAWTSPDRPYDGVGYFTEVLRPTVDRYETLFSAADRLEGIGVLAPELSGEIQEHAYWGGARDRIPLSQDNEMAPAGRPAVEVDGPVRRIRPADNVCVIRSGQDWTQTEADERRMYLEDVEPVLRAGMDFLRDDGLPIGCFFNRYVRVVDDAGTPTDKSYGLSWWSSLAALERWAESHPTHVAIFGAAMKYLSTLGPAARLKLYHEVTVASADQQLFEYLNCHDSTGMLRTAQ